MCSMMKRTIEIREEGVPEELLVVRKSWEEGGVRFLSWSFRAERETVFPRCGFTSRFRPEASITAGHPSST